MGWDSLISDRAATAFATTCGEKSSWLAEQEGLGRDGARAGDTQGTNWSCHSSWLSLLGCSTTCRAQSFTGRNRNPGQGHHKRLCGIHSSTLQAPHPPQFQGMLSSAVRVPKPPAALFIQECVPLAHFPHGTWLSSDPEMSWQVPGSLQLCSSTGRSHSLRANKPFL